jgi:threonine/homoserine efflux transporter RhtA
MATRRRLQFIQAQVAWMLAVVVVLAVLGSLELELFFVLSLIGFLIVIELTAPIAVTPAWRRRLPWFIAIGLVVFGIIVVRRILEILPPGVFG